MAVGSCLEFLRKIKPPCMRMCLREVVCELPFLQKLGGWIEGTWEKFYSYSRKGLVVLQS